MSPTTSSLDMVLTPGDYVAELSFDRPCDTEVLRRALSAMGWEGVVFDEGPSPTTGVGFARPGATSATTAASARTTKAKAKVNQKPPAPPAEPPICVAARAAIARGSPAAASLVAQCRALGVQIDFTPPVHSAEEGTYIDAYGRRMPSTPQPKALGRAAPRTTVVSTVPKPSGMTTVKKTAADDLRAKLGAKAFKKAPPVAAPPASPEETAALSAGVASAVEVVKTYGVGAACALPKAKADGTFDPAEAKAFVDCVNAAIDAYNAAPAETPPPSPPPAETPPASPPFIADQYGPPGPPPTPVAPAVPPPQVSPGGGGGGGAYGQADGQLAEVPPPESYLPPPKAPPPVPTVPTVPATPVEDPLSALIRRLITLTPGDPAPSEPVPDETTEIKTLRLQNLWRRWTEWGSPFSTSPQGTIDAVAMSNVRVSGTSEDEPTRIRFLGRLRSSIRLSNPPGMRWLMVKRLGIEYDGDIRIHVEPHRLDPGHFYEFRLLSRDKSAPDRETVKARLAEMGWAPMKLSLLKRNIRLPGRPSSLSMWYGMGQWLYPSTIVTVEDPFYFEQVVEASP